MKTQIKKAVVLCSGGVDSTTVMAMAKEEGYQIYSLSFYYGQRHAVELEAAKTVAKALGALEHLVIDVDLAAIGGSALTSDMEVPKGRTEQEMEHGIPETYVPARNTIFLSYALAWAEVLGASDIFAGVNAIDYSGYPDCRGEFIAAFEKTANLATAAALQDRGQYCINTPIIEMTKADIILTGTRLNVDYSLTHSCYDPDEKGRSCGRCDSCRLRLKGFAEAGLTDPIEYAK